jgi:hypothetical protein
MKMDRGSRGSPLGLPPPRGTNRSRREWLVGEEPQLFDLRVGVTLIFSRKKILNSQDLFVERTLEDDRKMI